MKNSSPVYRAGTRRSPLSLKQTEYALAKLTASFPALSFELVGMSTPGDRDKQSDLRASAPNFFTQDLDQALLSGEIDLAVHSAKDLPEHLPDGLDFLWLPWHEDPRDVLVLRQDSKHLPEHPKAGISSVRRETYCRKRFPSAEILPIRGNIGDRIAQLDAGKFDFLIMAAAGLARLGLDGRISEYIPLTELEPPDGQGHLAITFRADNALFRKLRLAFVKPVVFAGAGPGRKELATLATLKALSACEVCVYDSLLDEDLLSLLPKTAKRIFAGKRKAAHHLPQEEICSILADFARQGKRVVRLKGGDPGLFGRLAEETATMESLALPYRVIPGVSSFQAASACTGLLLTRRGESRGFTAMAPRKANSKDFEAISTAERATFPQVFFMGATETEKIGAQLLAEGFAPSTPVALVLAAGTDDEEILPGTLAQMPRLEDGDSRPGIVIVGKTADRKWLFKKTGALAGRRVLLVCSETLLEKAKTAVEDFGGTALEMPMIKLVPDFAAIDALPPFQGIDWLSVASPSSARFLLERLREIGFDLRKLPKVIVCGSETALEFKRFGIIPDAMPEGNFSGDALAACAEKVVRPGERLLHLKSDLAVKRKALNGEVEEAVIYRNEKMAVAALPDFDLAFLSSPSNVKNLVERFGEGVLKGKTCMAIGMPTFETIKISCPDCKALVSPEATAQESIKALTWHELNKAFTT